MKRLISFFPVLVIIISLSGNIYAEGDELDKTRLENSVRKGNFALIEDLFTTSMDIRIGEDLYKSISNIEALSLLKEYFEGKEVVSFTLHSSTNNGELVYKENGVTSTIPVDFYLSSRNNGLIVSGINISNYPQNTALYTKMK